MQCPICGGEELRVVGNPKRGLKSDVRERKCTECGMEFIAVETAPYLKLSGQNITLDELKRLGILNELQDKYIENKKRSFKQHGASLF